MTNWNNIDLDTQAHLTILDSYSFEQLLLEIECNHRVINKETITAQFNLELGHKIEVAKDIFKNNLDTILEKALNDRSA